MNYGNFFTKKGWAKMGRYYATHPKQLKELLAKARKYATKSGLRTVKSEFLLVCRYVREVFTGRYKDYSGWSLIMIVGALAYVLTPADMMPDFWPVTGLIDDTAILLWATHKFGGELDKFREHLALRGKEEEDEKAAEEALDEIEDIEFEEIPPMRLEQN